MKDIMVAMQHLSIKLVAIVALVGQMGCATQARKPDDPPVTHRWIPYGTFEGTTGTSIERIPVRTFEGTTDTRPAIAHVEVRLAQAPEIARMSPNTALEGLAAAPGLATLGLVVGMLAPPVGGQLLAGAISMPFVGATNANTRARIAGALQEIDFPRRLRDTIQTRLAGGPAGRQDLEMTLQVLVLGYGFFAPGGPEVGLTCFSFDGEMTVTAADRVVYQDQMYMDPYRRSLDFPPPRCATLEAFAADGGKLARETLEEAGEVVAAVIIGRLRANR